MVFVKGSASGVNKEEVVRGKRPVETPVRTPVVMKSGKASVATPARIPAVITSIPTPSRRTTASSGRVRKK